MLEKTTLVVISYIIVFLSRQSPLVMIDVELNKTGVSMNETLYMSQETSAGSHSNTTAVLADEHEQFYRVAKEVTGLYLFPIVCVTGIIGNLLTFVVFIKFKPRSSTNVYLTALAISDTIKLLCDFLYFIVVFLEKIERHDASVKVFVTLYPVAHYILNFSLCNTAWLTVSVAIERYIYMKWPERARTICTITRAKITCCVVWMAAMLITVPFALRYEQIANNGTIDINVTHMWNNDKFKDAYVWFQNILRSIVPLIVLIIINTWIIMALSRATKEYYQRPIACKNRVTVMLVAIIIAFLVCITPDAIMSTVFGFGYTEAPYLIRGIREISDLLLSVNSAVNFILYFSLNKVFRHNFARVFCKNYYWEHLAIKHEGIT